MKCHGRFSLSSARSDRQKVQKPPNCAQSKPGESPAVSRAVGRSVGCFDIDVKTTSARLALLLLSRSFQPPPVLSGGWLYVQRLVYVDVGLFGQRLGS